uniref:Uncharacterized protein n=1 Tax=Arundo donax TaxID=35708 RepID=A0A0A8ZQ40_ARUDO
MCEPKSSCRTPEKQIYSILDKCQYAMGSLGYLEKDVNVLSDLKLKCEFIQAKRKFLHDRKGSCGS